MTVSEDDLFSFGALLKNFRTRRRLTQQQLAAAVGVHRHAISRWEHGDMLPQHKALVLELARRLLLDDQETRRMLEASLTALAPHWLVPWQRNPLFTGRQRVLEVLHSHLGADRPVALPPSFALHGLGGVGKTQVALEYAYRHMLEYSAVFWIGAESEEQIISSLWRIAGVLHLAERDGRDQQGMIAAVQRWLSSHSQWLLVWDGVEDLNELDRFLPSARQGAILITTRCQALGTFARGLSLCPMAREEAMLFLLRRARILEPEAGCEQVRRLATGKPGIFAAASDLVVALGGLPLALDQAGAYLEETQCGLPAYLDLFRARRATLLQQRGEGASYHPLSAWATLHLSVAATAGRHPALWDLLYACALLQPDALPEELFRQGAPYLGSQLEAVGHDPLEWDRVIAIACEYSLLSRQAETQTLSMHCLVQAVLQDIMTEVERKNWTCCVLAALNALFPEVAYNEWERCARLLPHVLVCATMRAERAPDLEGPADLWRKAADYLRERAQYGRAEALYRQALQSQRRAPGMALSARIAVLGGLALLSADLGRYQQAECYYQQALQLQEQASEVNPLAVARLLDGLACLCCHQGQYEQAEPLYQRALHIREQACGADHPLVAQTLAGLASLYRRQGRCEQAEPLYQRALHIQEQTLGPAHPDLATSLHGLAILCQERGRDEQAEALFKLAVQLREQALGPQHPRVAAPLYRLARLYAEQGGFERAEPLYQRALHIREQTLDPQHPDVAWPLSGLAALYGTRGQLEQAEAFGKRALQICKRAPGFQHPDAGYLLETLGAVYARQGRYEQAEALYRQALQTWERTLSLEHPAVAHALNELARLSLARGKDRQAEILYRRALQIRERHPALAETLSDLALVLRQRGDLQEARVCAERALQVRVQMLGDAHPQTIAAQILCAQLRPEAEDVGVAVAPVDGGDQALACAPDPLQDFLDACCELYPLAWCRISELWHTYEQWAVCVQHRVPLARRAFAAQLKARGCRVDRTNTARIWRGIGLVSRAP